MSIIILVLFKLPGASFLSLLGDSPNWHTAEPCTAPGGPADPPLESSLLVPPLPRGLRGSLPQLICYVDLCSLSGGALSRTGGLWGLIPTLPGAGCAALGWRHPISVPEAPVLLQPVELANPALRSLLVAVHRLSPVSWTLLGADGCLPSVCP